MDPTITELFKPASPAEQTGRILADTLEGAKQVNRSALENIERLIWQNPYGLEPQQVFDLLGKKAAAVLKLKALILPLLYAAFPSDPPQELKPKNVSVAANENGTVTVSEY